LATPVAPFDAVQGLFIYGSGGIGYGGTSASGDENVGYWMTAKATPPLASLVGQRPSVGLAAPPGGAAQQ